MGGATEGVRIDVGVVVGEASDGEEEEGTALEAVGESARSWESVETVTVVLMVQVTASLTALVELVLVGGVSATL